MQWGRVGCSWGSLATHTTRLLQLGIVCLGFAPFAVSEASPGNRLQLGFTLVLTSITFKFVVNQSLPKIPYLTYLVRTAGRGGMGSGKGVGSG